MDNYKVAVETADKCCQANAQFAEISEVCNHATHSRTAAGKYLMLYSCLGQVMTVQFFCSPHSVKSHAALYRGNDCFNCTVGQLLVF